MTTCGLDRLRRHGASTFWMVWMVHEHAHVLDGQSSCRFTHTKLLGYGLEVIEDCECSNVLFLGTATNI